MITLYVTLKKKEKTTSNEIKEESSEEKSKYCANYVNTVKLVANAVYCAYCGAKL